MCIACRDIFMEITSIALRRNAMMYCVRVMFPDQLTWLLNVDNLLFNYRLTRCMTINRAPSRVVNKHKKRASFVWVLILGLIAGYTIWLFCSTYKKRRTPEATLELQVSQGITTILQRMARTDTPLLDVRLAFLINSFRFDTFHHSRSS